MEDSNEEREKAARLGALNQPWERENIARIGAPTREEVDAWELLQQDNPRDHVGRRVPDGRLPLPAPGSGDCRPCRRTTPPPCVARFCLRPPPAATDVQFGHYRSGRVCGPRPVAGRLHPGRPYPEGNLVVPALLPTGPPLGGAPRTADMAVCSAGSFKSAILAGPQLARSAQCETLAHWAAQRSTTPSPSQSCWGFPHQATYVGCMGGYSVLSSFMFNSGMPHE